MITMSRILEIDGEFFVEFYGNGLRFRKKAGKSRTQAEAKMREIEESMQTSALEVAPGTATVEMFLERFNAYADQMYPALTAVRIKSAAKHCVAYLTRILKEPVLVRHITPRLMEDYKKDLIATEPARTTLVNLTLYLLFEVFQFAIALGWLNDNPLQHTPLVEERVRRIPVVYGEDQLVELRKELSPTEAGVFALHLYAGLLPREVQQLTVTDLDFSKLEIEVAQMKGKGDSRIVPMDLKLCEILQPIVTTFQDQAPLFESYQLPLSMNSYYLRNTFIRNVLHRGVTLIRLNDLLGSADIARVFRYRVFLPLP